MKRNSIPLFFGLLSAAFTIWALAEIFLLGDEKIMDTGNRLLFFLAFITANTAYRSWVKIRARQQSLRNVSR
jgi:hypothetical protein